MMVKVSKITQSMARGSYKMFVKIALALAIISFTGCQAVSRKPTSEEYSTDKIGYYLDARTKLCFAVISYDRMDTSARVASGLTHTNVPCNPEVLALINKGN